MKHSILIISLLALFGCRSNQTIIKVNNGAEISDATIITFGPTGNMETYVGTIVIDSNKIVYAGNQKPVVKGNYQKVSAKDKFLIPGLIDSHVHLMNMAGMNRRQQKNHPELTSQYFKQLPKSFLYYGYTTLIDLNNYAPAKLNQLRKSELRPDIYACGKMLQVMDDFEMEMEELPPNVRLQQPFVHDHYNDHIHIPDSIDLNAHSVQSIIKNIVEEQNGICVKTLYEDASSGMMETWEKPSVKILEDIAKEAKSANIISVIHAPSFEGQQMAVEAQMDIIAHAMWNWTDDPAQFADTTLSKEQKSLLDKIVKNQIGYQPTYRAITSELDILDNRIQTDTNFNSVLPKAYLDWQKSEEGNWFLHRILNRFKFLKMTNPDFFEKVRSQFSSDEELRSTIYNVLLERMNKVVHYLAEKDANLLLGTDFGVMNMYSCPPGYSGFLEMNHWAQAGVDLEMILKAATYNNANAFNLDHLYGTIEKGKPANLLLLNANPLENVDAYNKIDLVIMNGKLIPRQELSAQ